jgi:hypothetical protein
MGSNLSAEGEKIFYFLFAICHLLLVNAVCPQ